MSTSTSPVDIRPDHLEIVQDILRDHLPAGFQVWVFGSRAKWTATDASDLDLAVEGDDSLDYKTMVGLEVAFEESNLPYTVDVMDLNAVSKEFKKIVEAQRVPLPPTAARKASGEWRSVALGELIDIDHGYAFKGSFISSEPQDQSDILLTPGNFAIGGGFKGDKFKYYNGDTPDEFALHPGDLLVTMTDLSKESDTLGYPALVPPRSDSRRYLHNQRLGKIRLKETNDVESRYLYYVMCSRDYRNEILASCTGTTVKHTSPERIKQYRFLLPAKEEQQAIARILGTLDDKIELNRRMNETLEQIPRAIFQDWFVDFGPVRAKMEGQEPYLPPELWALFPERFVDSELGETPKGWEVKALGDCIDVARGLSYKGSGLSSDGVPMHNLNSIYEGGGYKDDGIKYYNGDFRDRHTTEPGDVIVANTEQGHDRLLIGFAAIVPKRFGNRGLFSHHLYRARPKASAGLSNDFVCHSLNTLITHGTVSGYATGTTVNMLPSDALRIPSIGIPPAQLVEGFSTIAESARNRQEQTIVESQLLTAQRDALLPKLVSGEVRLGMMNELADGIKE